MRRILFSINSYSRHLDAAIAARLARRHWGDRVFIHHYTTWDGDSFSLTDFYNQDVDYLVIGPNSGHHNGVRDAWNDLSRLLHHAARRHRRGDSFDWVISTHCDTLWSDLSVVDEILGICERTGMLAAVTTGGDPENGAMRNPRFMGYFCNFLAFKPEVVTAILPMTHPFDGELWAEVNIRQALDRELRPEAIYDIPCLSVDRLGLDTFESVLGDPEKWFSCGHDLSVKLKRLSVQNPEAYASIADLLVA